MSLDGGKAIPAVTLTHNTLTLVSTSALKLDTNRNKIKISQEDTHTIYVFNCDNISTNFIG